VGSAGERQRNTRTGRGELANDTVHSAATTPGPRPPQPLLGAGARGSCGGASREEDLHRHRGPPQDGQTACGGQQVAAAGAMEGASSPGPPAGPPWTGSRWWGRESPLFHHLAHPGGDVDLQGRIEDGAADDAGVMREWSAGTGTLTRGRVADGWGSRGYGSHLAQASKHLERLEGALESNRTIWIGSSRANEVEKWA